MKQSYYNILERTVEGTELLSLAEVKRHLNMQFDTSGSYEMNDDDTKLTELITETRSIIEEVTGLVLIETRLKLSFQNDYEGLLLPGPVRNIYYVNDKEGNTLEHEVNGDYLIYPDKGTVYYSAGYTSETLPSGLKLKWKEFIAFVYRFRGDSEQRTRHAEDNFLMYSKRTFLV